MLACCSVFDRVAMCYSALQCAAVCCSVVQCVAVCCTVLQCIVACCSVLQWVLQFAAVCCKVWQCAAVCCSMLPCIAVCHSVLQSVAVCSSLYLIVYLCSMSRVYHIQNNIWDTLYNIWDTISVHFMTLTICGWWPVYMRNYIIWDATFVKCTNVVIHILCRVSHILFWIWYKRDIKHTYFTYLFSILYTQNVMHNVYVLHMMCKWVMRHYICGWCSVCMRYYKQKR